VISYRNRIGLDSVPNQGNDGRQFPWDHGQGYQRDEKGFPRERQNSHLKFLHYRDQGPGRTQVATAKHFGTSRTAINELALKFNWVGRAKEWDARTEESATNPDLAPPLPQPLLEAASRPPVELVSSRNPDALPSLPPEIRAKELEHEQMLEMFREESESLGRHQMKLARAMTQIASKSVARMLERQELLKSREIPSFVASACSLAASAHHNWGRAIGVDRLLLQMERAVLELDARVIEDAEVIG
jgi:hypothetical protein